ncbi:AP-1 complex subunit sigma-1A [Theileria parva strain Muguga]|uniref:AP complex subunit sigma n=1 Tax=Theileria parva TaxID=5875 RepID=Q4N7R6_THEPA|nr:AP-1 complex subunit sigma-1A [Theileria parva strain Muguga]EAN33992.1 AP-1 complex subunit sigma-1A [Theileria parva strain Muguga]|eukprot:XP_766275.1 clathrin assembly protein [Theileria parva strain Muguga]
MIKFFISLNRQSKVRLVRWFIPVTSKEKSSIIQDLSHMVVNRSLKQCNFLEWREYKVVFKRFASLYFIACVDKDANELLVLEMIQRYVEILDSYFCNVCELDLVFNFTKAYHLLDEILIDGDIYDTNKKGILRNMSAQDAMSEKTKTFSSKS